MSVSVRAITDVNLSRDDVKEIIEKTYGPIIREYGSSADENVMYLQVQDKSLSDTRQIQVGLEGTFSCDDVNCEGLAKDFSSKVSISLGDKGDAETILKGVLAAVGGYYVDGNDVVTPVEKSVNILDLNDDAILMRRAEAWANSTVATLNVPAASVDEFVGKLQEVYIEAKSIAPELNAPKPASPEM